MTFAHWVCNGTKRSHNLKYLESLIPLMMFFRLSNSSPFLRNTWQFILNIIKQNKSLLSFLEVKFVCLRTYTHLSKSYDFDPNTKLLCAGFVVNPPPPGDPWGQRKNMCDKNGRGTWKWIKKGRGTGKWSEKGTAHWKIKELKWLIR